jgi:nicotinamidase-related amidase
MPSCLIVIDMQNDFIDGALGFPKAAAVVQNVKRKLDQARASGIDVYFTLDTHASDYLESEEGTNLPIVHCQKGTHGHKLSATLEPYRTDAAAVFEKPTFASLDLANHLKNKAYDRVELCGLVSNICVLSNAVMVKGALPQAHIVVDKNATASYDEALHAAALAILQSIHVELTEDSNLG